MHACLAQLAFAVAVLVVQPLALADASTAERQAAAPAQVDPTDDFAFRVRLLAPGCSRAPRSEHEQAVAWFVARPETHARLVALLDPRSPDFAPMVLEVLVRFGRADSVPAMEHLLAAGIELRSWDAGQALGAHPSPSARAALLRQVRSTNKQTVFGATLGLMNRHDASVCPALLAESAKSTGTPRDYYLFQASARLGCIDRARLETIARNDPDADLRQLAGRVLRGEP